MKGTWASAVLTPTAAIVSALATLACCLPWGIGAALGAVGLSVFFFQIPSLVLGLFCRAAFLWILSAVPQRCRL
jgi:hypothetical protein